ncbi:hypothetical protein K2173_010253 [Erythroxylum novogranatense]|uniref:Uncharacterized protein n=1 Tax=Erythroxylum novogranatense TaxID=1862640 RepID=A0AAV8U9E0_9ROSI|nr:hypothetical protein K2173_010253 [Erythroxylum novogranatense]
MGLLRGTICSQRTLINWYNRLLNCRLLRGTICSQRTLINWYNRLLNCRKKIRILATFVFQLVYKRLQLKLELVKKEMEISKIQESIAKAIEENISGEQRRYLLNEQLKAIKKELGLETDDKTALSVKFRERIEPKKEKIPAQVSQVIEEELTKLQLLEASSSEFNVTRNYLDWLTTLRWGDYSDENFDVVRAQNILDEDHCGLTDVKERILEFIAVGKLKGISQAQNPNLFGICIRMAIEMSMGRSGLS